MVHEVADVKFTEKVDLNYKGEEYNFASGDIGTFDVRYANKLSFKWQIADIVSDRYQVLDEDFEQVIGYKEPADAPLNDENGGDYSEMSYSEVQSLAKEHGIKANQSKQDLIDAIKEVE